MSQLIKEKEVSSVPTNVVFQLDYLEESFPVSTGEYQVDYKSVGENRFRINFWSYKNNSGVSPFFRSSYISRSHYVILERKDVSWTHTIL